MDRLQRDRLTAQPFGSGASNSTVETPMNTLTWASDWRRGINDSRVPQRAGGEQAARSGLREQFLGFLGTCGGTMFGVDFSSTALRRARELSGRAKLTQADAHRLPFGDSFDWVISCETSEHLSEPLAALRDMWRGYVAQMADYCSRPPTTAILAVCITSSGYCAEGVGFCRRVNLLTVLGLCFTSGCSSGGQAGGCCSLMGPYIRCPFRDGATCA